MKKTQTTQAVFFPSVCMCQTLASHRGVEANETDLVPGMMVFTALCKRRSINISPHQQIAILKNARKNMYRMRWMCGNQSYIE